MVYQSVWTKLKPKREIPISEVTRGSVQKILPQSGKIIDYKRDAGRQAKLPGVRISKTGKKYWETRGNRSDAPMKRIWRGG